MRTKFRAQLSRGVEAIAVLGLTLTLSVSGAATTKVGNGDDGRDLEGSERVTSGVLVDTQKLAVDRLKKLQVQNVDGLGALIPEVERSQLLLIKQEAELNVVDERESQTDVYARTFAEPHAATRFFPKALLLNQEQLVQLHIHEGLHRSLPAQIREDEEVVSRITLALTSPDSSLDRVRKVMKKELASPVRAQRDELIDPWGPESDLRAKWRAKNQAQPIENPSTFSYEYRNFFQDGKSTTVNVQGMHLLKSHLFFTGSADEAFGLGLDLSYIRESEQSYLGPIGLSGRARVATVRGFDVSLWLALALNTIAADEWKGSPLGRDVTTGGLALTRETERFYIENRIGVSGTGSVKQSYGNIEYQHKYGQVTTVGLRGGAKYKGFSGGAGGEIMLGDSYSFSGGNYVYKVDRTRAVTFGPEIGYKTADFGFTLGARWVIDSTKNMKLEMLGDILGRGVGQGFVQSSLSVYF